MKSTLAVIVAKYVRDKLKAHQFCELWYWTPAGAVNARQSSTATISGANAEGGVDIGNSIAIKLAPNRERRRRDASCGTHAPTAPSHYHASVPLSLALSRLRYLQSHCAPCAVSKNHPPSPFGKPSRLVCAMGDPLGRPGAHPRSSGTAGSAPAPGLSHHRSHRPARVARHESSGNQPSERAIIPSRMVSGKANGHGEPSALSAFRRRRTLLLTLDPRVRHSSTVEYPTGV